MNIIFTDFSSHKYIFKEIHHDFAVLFPDILWQATKMREMTQHAVRPKIEFWWFLCI